jgi:hypothetical protein
VFESIPVTRGHGHVRVQAEALDPRAARRRTGWPARGPRGHAALQRGGDRLREERLLRRERVATMVVLRQSAAARQEAPDAAVQLREERVMSASVGGGRRWKMGRAVGAERV